MLYHKDYPQGVVFDTEPNKADPLVPSRGTGWTEHREDLKLTTDQIVEAAVKQELARQSSDRIPAERELVKKTRMETGRDVRPSALVPDKKIIDALDNRA